MSPSIAATVESLADDHYKRPRDEEELLEIKELLISWPPVTGTGATGQILTSSTPLLVCRNCLLESSAPRIALMFELARAMLSHQE